jgi:Fe-S-cluster containining protein
MLHEYPEIPAILQALSSLYEQIDLRVKRLVEIHARRLRCRRGCADCCVDDISVNEAEALNIRHFYADLLSEKKPHPEGVCAFFSGDNSCRIYDRRPYICRTQGLPLFWLEEKEGKTMALRDICPKNEKGIPIEQLHETECWRIGSVELELAKLQCMIRKGPMRRVKLRNLFH